jgi:DNA-binding CsgD family transcriptional regulator
MKSAGQFSPQESKVIELLLKGKSNKQMAAMLQVTARTIEYHLSNIYKKLGASSRIEAVLKLQEKYPRESTGTDLNVSAGESTVVKKEKLPKISESIAQPWIQKMPNAIYLLLSVVLLMIVLGVGSLVLGRANNPPLTPQQVTAPATVTPPAMQTPRFSPIALLSPTAVPSMQSSPTFTPTASPATASTPSNAGTCNGVIPAHPAGPTVNLSLANKTRASITISLFLARNKFGECGYRSYVLSQLSSIALTEVLPYGCYYTYAIINDPKNPTHVTSGPDCITEADKITFTVTYTNIKISPIP